MTGKPQVCTREGCADRPVARRLCHRHYQAAWKAGSLDAHQRQPRRIQDRKLCPTGHRHGETTTCYVHHQCRCMQCTENAVAVETRRRKQKAYGRYDSGLVDVAPVREHMLALGEFGIGYKRVAMLAGVGITPARNIIWGRQDPGPRHGEMLKRVKRETAEKILAVQPVFENLAPGQKVPATGTHRRLQALVVAGWSQAKLATRMGLGNDELTTLLRRDHVLVSTHLAARDLFDELWNQEPPHEEWPDKVAFSRSKNFARARRWLPALAWDDIDTDVEPPVPDEIDGIDETAVVLAMQGEPVRLTPMERRECVLRLHRERWSDGRIAETIGCASKTVERIREELGLESFDQTELRARGAA